MEFPFDSSQVLKTVNKQKLNIKYIHTLQQYIFAAEYIPLTHDMQT